MNGSRVLLALVLPVLAAAPALTGCPKAKPQEDPADAAVLLAPVPVPPVAPGNGTPAIDAGFGDSDLEGKSPFEQSQILFARGELWKSRLLIESQALSSGGTKDEAELLVKICQQQVDAACVDACSKKLGRKIKLADPTVAVKGGPSASASGAPVHEEPDNDLARARNLVLKSKGDQARKILEPKVLDGSASREEIRLLRAVCAQQADRMCVAVCDQKLK